MLRSAIESPILRKLSHNTKNYPPSPTIGFLKQEDKFQKGKLSTNENQYFIIFMTFSMSDKSNPQKKRIISTVFKHKNTLK